MTMTLYDFSFNLCNSNKITIMGQNNVLTFEDDDALYEEIKSNKTLGNNTISWFSVENDGSLTIYVKGNI